jgi:hypothetical protein
VPPAEAIPLPVAAGWLHAAAPGASASNGTVSRALY